MPSFVVYPSEAAQAGCTISGGLKAEENYTYEYSYGKSEATIKYVDIEAIPANGWRFNRWVFSSSYTYNDSSGNTSERDEHTVNTDNPLQGSTEYYSHDPARLNPPYPYQFDYEQSDTTIYGDWSTQTVSIIEIVAEFVRDENYVTVSVSSNPQSAGRVTGGGSYRKSSSVTVSATPSSTDYRFVEWRKGSSVVSRSASYTFTANENVSLVAIFETIIRGKLTVQVLAPADISVAGITIRIDDHTKTTDANGRFVIDDFIQGRSDIDCPNISGCDLGRIYTESAQNTIPFTIEVNPYRHTGYGEYVIRKDSTLYFEFVKSGYMFKTKRLDELLKGWSNDSLLVSASYFDNFYRDRSQWYEANIEPLGRDSIPVAVRNTKTTDGIISRINLNVNSAFAQLYDNKIFLNGEFLSRGQDDWNFNYRYNDVSSEETRSSVPQEYLETIEQIDCPITTVDAQYLDEFFDVFVHADKYVLSRVGDVILRFEHSFTSDRTLFSYDRSFDITDRYASISGVLPKVGRFSVCFKSTWVPYQKPKIVKIDGVEVHGYETGPGLYKVMTYDYDVSRDRKHRIDIYFTLVKGLLYSRKMNNLIFNGNNGQLVYTHPKPSEL